jgi:hypothetical protein
MAIRYRRFGHSFAIVVFLLLVLVLLYVALELWKHSSHSASARAKQDKSEVVPTASSDHMDLSPRSKPYAFYLNPAQKRTIIGPLRFTAPGAPKKVNWGFYLFAKSQKAFVRFGDDRELTPITDGVNFPDQGPKTFSLVFEDVVPKESGTQAKLKIWVWEGPKPPADYLDLVNAGH